MYSGVIQRSGIEVVGPVYPDESTEEAPSLHDVASLLRERDGSSSSDAGVCGSEM